jgi:pilus assembly protein CpaE
MSLSGSRIRVRLPWAQPSGPSGSDLEPDRPAFELAAPTDTRLARAPTPSPNGRPPAGDPAATRRQRTASATEPAADEDRPLGTATPADVIEDEPPTGLPFQSGVDITTEGDRSYEQRELRILLVEDVPEVAARIRELLRSQPAIRIVDTIADGRRVVDAVGELRPDVVIVDALLQGRVKGPAVIDRLRGALAPVSCIALTVPDQPLADALLGKVDAVLTLPIGTFDLIGAIRGAVAAGAARNPAAASRVIAVFSAKGGVGKTTIAFNLAVAIGQTGLRTALVDGNLQFGDLRRLLRIGGDAPSIYDLPTDSVRTSDLGSVMVEDPSGIDVLFAPPRVEMAELITARDLEKILGMLRRTYSAIVVDTPSTLSDTTLTVLDAADVIIQVVAPESSSLDSARTATQAFAEIGYPSSKIQLLLNRADSRGGVTRGQVQWAFGRDPDHEVASDWELVAHSNGEGVPFVLARPEAQVSADLRAVADRVRTIVGASPPATPVRRRR